MSISYFTGFEENDLTIDSWTLGGGTTNTISIAASADDNSRVGAVYSNSHPECRAGNIGGSALDTGMRFAGITIPQGATILSAYIKFTAQYSRSSQTVASRIYGEKSATPAQYGASEDFSARTKTTAYTTNTTASSWTAETTYDSSDISTVIQELVNAYDYSSGAINLFWMNNASGSNQFQSAYTYDSSVAKAPQLIITWVTSLAPSSTYKKTGSYALRCCTSASTAYISTALTIQRFSFHIRIITMPDVDIVIFRAGNIYLWLTTEGYLKVYEGTVPRGICHYAIDNSGWYRISGGFGSATASWVALNSSKQIKNVDCSDTTTGSDYLGIQTTSTAEIYFDNFVCDDTYSLTDLGDCRVLIAIPNAAGTYQEWTASAGTHVSCIDDVPGSVSDADYITGGSAYYIDTFNIADHLTLGISETDTIKSLSIKKRCRAANAGFRMYDVLLDNGTQANTYLSVGTTFAWYSNIYNTMPYDSADWTLDRFDLVQVGVKRNNQTYTTYCSVLWVMVLYSTAEEGTIPSASPDTMIDATWNQPSEWIANEGNGVLYLCVRDGSNTRIYKSIDYGKLWALGAEVAGKSFYKVISNFTSGFLASDGSKLYSASTLDGTWTEVSGFGDYGNISADTNITKKTIADPLTGIPTPIFLCSYQGTNGHLGLEYSSTGSTWTILFDNYQPISGQGRIAIFNAFDAWCFTHGTTDVIGSINFQPNIGTPTQPFWTPYHSPDALGTFGYETTGYTETYRTYRPGIDEANSRIVLGAFGTGIYSTDFAYSTNCGASFSTKAIPAGMQPTATYPDYDITCIGNTVLAHCVSCSAPGIYRSADFGTTWTLVQEVFGSAETTSGVQIDPYNPNMVYAWGSYGFTYSEDNGVTWNWEGYYLEGDAEYLVVTKNATKISNTGFTLNGELVDGGSDTWLGYFEWGETTDYGNTTSSYSVVTHDDFSHAVTTSVIAEQIYHFRAVAELANIKIYGEDKTFKLTVYQDRVTGLVHRVGPKHYSLEIHLGGLSTYWNFSQVGTANTPAVIEDRTGWVGPLYELTDEGPEWFWLLPDGSRKYIYTEE